MIADTILSILARLLPVVRDVAEYLVGDTRDSGQEAVLRRRLIRAAFDERAEQEIDETPPDGTPGPT